MLVGSKGGDNAQVLRAADAMGLDYELRRIVLRREFETAKPRVRATINHIDRAASDDMSPPWPDLVITIGRRPAMVALWIKAQTNGACRIALFNAPKGNGDLFDLIVVPAYYRIADDPRTCRIDLPLMAVDPLKIKAAHLQFSETIGRMPRPIDVLLLGGGTGMMRLDSDTARTIVDAVHATQTGGGSLYISTSRRTDPRIADALEPLLRPADKIYRWTPDAADNPYLGLLAHGDRFTVTGDSISMIVEVARLGRPLAIAELPQINMFLLRAAQRLGWRNPSGPLASRILAIGTGWQVRDFDVLYRYLYSKHFAVPLGQLPQAPVDLPTDDTRLVAERLRKLVGLAS